MARKYRQEIYYVCDICKEECQPVKSLTFSDDMSVTAEIRFFFFHE